MNIDFAMINDPEQLRDLFELTAEHGLLGRTFYGRVNTLSEFMELVQRAHVFAFEQDGEIVGFTWINMWLGRAAAIHGCLWPTAENKVELGKSHLRYILEMPGTARHWLDCIYGAVPASYPNVAKYALACGMQRTGLIPMAVEMPGGVAEDLHLFAITREDI